MPESVKVFLSTVSDEFGAYREQLRKDLARHNVEVKVQEDFKDLGGDTLDKLDVYIAHCDCVVHLVGDMTGSTPLKRDVDALLAEHSDLFAKLPPLGEAVRDGVGVSYTQWEAWLALYHRKLLVIAKAADKAERNGPHPIRPSATFPGAAGEGALLSRPDRKVTNWAIAWVTVFFPLQRHRAVTTVPHPIRPSATFPGQSRGRGAAHPGHATLFCNASP